jgi:anti-sigma regulatory factor (Ser/Thr protein kinase)
VLDIAKIESGQFTLNMAEYALESVVETVRSATESLAQNKKLALKTDVAKPLPAGVGDEQRLTQVLLNLVGNAIKFTDAREVLVSARAVNGHFNVIVSDTGPGIPEEHQARIFEQFHQVDSSNTGQGRHRFGSRNRQADRGDAWWSHLGGIDPGQRLDVSDGGPHSGRVSQVGAMSKRILVEDQEDLRGMLHDLLSGTGYTVIEAENGERGVATNRRIVSFQRASTILPSSTRTRAAIQRSNHSTDVRLISQNTSSLRTSTGFLYSQTTSLASWMSSGDTARRSHSTIAPSRLQKRWCLKMSSSWPRS